MVNVNSHIKCIASALLAAHGKVLAIYRSIGIIRTQYRTTVYMLADLPSRVSHQKQYLTIGLAILVLESVIPDMDL
jgi:hypothetical protein